MTHTAQTYLKLLILQRALALYENHFSGMLMSSFPQYFKEGFSIEEHSQALNLDNANEIFSNLEHDDAIQDARSEVRNSCDSEDADIAPTSHSRHYEVESKAINVNGQWVVFDYYSGGGKFGDPDSDFDWIESARLVNCKEEEVKTINRTFSLIDGGKND